MENCAEQNRRRTSAGKILMKFPEWTKGYDQINVNPLRTGNTRKDKRTKDKLG
jgi:hypothetical protein